jgi:threonine/homoserine/homoserine lactone efflux protein
MASLPLLAGAAAAAASSTLAPGPAFLSLLGIGAAQGRRPAAWFIIGHRAGDVLWSTLAITAIIGSRTLGPLAFEVLGLVCGAYLMWLGMRAITARAVAGGRSALAVRRPLLRGIAFGLTNPKGYPVAIAVFTAFLAGHGAITWGMLPGLEGAACAGFLAADVLVVGLVGAAWSRRLFRRHERTITRLCGLVFIGFGVEAALGAVAGLLGRGETDMAPVNAGPAG